LRRCAFDGTEVVAVLKPMSFMNRSGGPVHSNRRFSTRCRPESILVAYDEPGLRARSHTAGETGWAGRSRAQRQCADVDLTDGPISFWRLRHRHSDIQVDRARRLLNYVLGAALG